jgi:DNA-binding transcriptional LysR family regulator
MVISGDRCEQAHWHEFRSDEHGHTQGHGSNGAPGTYHREIGLAAVRQGAGLFYVADPMAREDLDKGVLRTALEDWSPFGPGFHIYYSSRRQIPEPLRLFIELVRDVKPLGL